MQERYIQESLKCLQTLDAQFQKAGAIQDIGAAKTINDERYILTFELYRHYNAINEPRKADSFKKLLKKYDEIWGKLYNLLYNKKNDREQND